MSQSLHAIGALTTILGGISSLCYGLTYLQTPASPPPSARRALGFLPLRLPDPEKEPSKYHFEVYCVRYSVVWMAIFGCIVGEERRGRSGIGAVCDVGRRHWLRWRSCSCCAALSLSVAPSSPAPNYLLLQHVRKP